MKIKRALLALLIITAGCGKKGDAPTNKPDDKPATPAPTLITPAQNEVCASGTILTDTTAAITFKWGTVANINSYQFNVRDLVHQTNVTRTLNTNTVTVTLKRNVPYSWQVGIKNDAGDVQSEERRFYVAGKGVTTYAPFPAELISPRQGESLVTTFSTLALFWKGSSVSDNIAGYDIYFGKVSDPPLFQSSPWPYPANCSVPVERGNTYFWRIVTIDVNGNKSTSPLFQFNNR